jgi:hypothetical protein
MATVSLYPIMNLQKSTYPLVNMQKTIEHCHLLLIYLVKMVTFHSYVSLPEGKSCITRGLPAHFFGWPWGYSKFWAPNQATICGPTWLGSDGDQADEWPLGAEKPGELGLLVCFNLFYIDCR